MTTRPIILCAVLALGAPVAEADTIHHLADNTFCRDAGGKRLVPHVKPDVPAQAQRAKNAMVETTLADGRDCFLFMTEVVLTAKPPPCPQANSGTGGTGVAGTLGDPDPSCTSPNQ